MFTICKKFRTYISGVSINSRYFAINALVTVKSVRYKLSDGKFGICQQHQTIILVILY